MYPSHWEQIPEMQCCNFARGEGGYASPTHANIGLLLWQLLYVRLEQK